MSTKIKPAIRGPKNYCDFSELKVGDTFIWHSGLFRKLTNNNDNMVGRQAAYNFAADNISYEMCGEEVLPVDVVITWTKQKE